MQEVTGSIPVVSTKKKRVGSQNLPSSFWWTPSANQNHAATRHARCGIFAPVSRQPRLRFGANFGSDSSCRRSPNLNHAATRHARCGIFAQVSRQPRLRFGANIGSDSSCFGESEPRLMYRGAIRHLDTSSILAHDTRQDRLSPGANIGSDSSHSLGYFSEPAQADDSFT